MRCCSTANISSTEALASGVRARGRGFRRRRSPTERLAALAAQPRARARRTIAVTDPVLAAISPVRTPSGVVAIARAARQPRSSERLRERRRRWSCMLSERAGSRQRRRDRPRRRGVRRDRADRSEGTADPFGWKALRGAMGSTLPAADRAPDSRCPMRLVARAPAGCACSPLRRATARRCRDCDLRGPAAILSRRRRRRLPPDLLDAADDAPDDPDAGRRSSR